MKTPFQPCKQPTVFRFNEENNDEKGDEHSYVRWVEQK